MEEQSSGSEPGPVEAAGARVVGALRPLVPDVVALPRGNYLEVVVPVDQLEAAARTIRDQLSYSYLSMVTAVDYPPDRIEVIYLAFSLGHPYGVTLKTTLPRQELPDCPTLTTVWPGAEFQEREVYDLMGVNFVGHPDMTRILTEDDFPGHPLRKDFSIEPDYVLMRHLRYGAEGQLAPPNEAEQTRGADGGSTA